jgi:diaminohydroxyphosphoribosylaminopyrimidine deaminase/5-amino-6-(5-phosphoribosylamino)uracil reductase
MSLEPPMRRALELARQAWGRTHPNPMVGAVLTEDGVIVAEGFHAKAGEPHAEVMVLRNLGRRPKPDAILHVTLEPCCTHGRTPPCVDAIVEAGLRTVVVGALDPNPAHAGHGLALLRSKGVAVVEGVLATDCTDLNLIFNHWIVAQRPLLALKVASSLDGRLVPADGMSPWITGEAARANVQEWRALFPAIAVSVDTLLKDNPRLTARLPEGERCGIRFVLDRHFRSAGKAGLNLFRDAYNDRTIVVGMESAVRTADLRWYEAEGVSYWCLPGGPEDFLTNWIARCALEQVTGVMVEAGPRLAAGLMEEGRVDYLLAYVAPMFTGNPDSPVWASSAVGQLIDPRVEVFGQDALYRGYLA